MEITRIVTGNLAENCYLVWQQNDLLIIDPGADAQLIMDTIATIDATPQAILLTHTHSDHIGAVDAIRDIYQIPVYVSPLENSWLQDPVRNLSGAQPITARPAEHEFDLKTYTIGTISFKVVATPGHSIGSVSFIFDDFVVCGDALFRGSIGRTDLYTGNLEQLLTSIQTQLFTLPDQFPVYPGHGDSTTIEHEKRTNPFFNR
ncbi:MBL fold metallo-hydrolase [Enterococcus saccharolyticus]|uniref:Hydrolase n=1 Tax=Candidatus Enterococcus willemsii TaxID=1857215 RepID=A0ABQ6Z2L4_9ENTE|nr:MULTISPECIES: MBL fold metallo-hydrolase [Enterococcus]KAF1305615.1 hydrolase [Enterococcus sp. CU12B]MCD5000876.1 MBL fold metallo-hydrolase [Enterococcus saccharolyticus]